MSLRFIFYFTICGSTPLFSSAQTRYGVLISEFLPDPTPSAGLPESSFIELNNHSSFDYNLRGWKISNGSSSASIKADYILKAGSILILCSASAAPAYGNFGPAIGITGFPALNNDAGVIILSSETGFVLHAIQYDKSWYGNALKAAGGWSLEMIDPSNPCAGRENWTASISPSGGTPGSKNSVDAENRDEQPPNLLRSVTLDSAELILFFNEALDSLSASSSGNYLISDGIGSPETAAALPPFFDQVHIHLSKPMAAGKIYSVSVQQIRDCSGNETGPDNSCKAGIPEKAGVGDIIFNEILFNPPPYGFDYLELYNRSKRIINCSGLFLAGRDMSGALKNPVVLVKEERTFFPGEYLLLTENPDWVLQNYPLSGAAQMLFVSAMPSMPDDLGKVVLLDASGESIDELDYDHHWHSPLLANETGVALERIHVDGPESQATNWTSAAASAGYGTPGYKNSESSADSIRSDFISVEPKIFSPDQDGYEDFCFIQFHLPAAGFIGSISIYDVFGRMVRKLVNNVIWESSGSWRWDGLDDRQNLLPMGQYIIYAELFLPQGSVKKNVSVCVLARRS
jgi:hypothetical protein